MSFTVWSIFIPIAVYFFLADRKKLFYLLVLTSTMPAATVINVGRVGIQISHFISILLVIRYLFLYLPSHGFKVKAPGACLSSLLILAVISMMAAAWRSKSVLVSGIGNGSALVYAAFSFQNITQFLYLAVGFLTYWMTLEELRGEEARKIIRLLVCSQVILSVFAVIQMVCNRFGLPYHEILRTTPELTERGRIYSLTGEPSIFAQSSVIISAILLTVNVWKDKKTNYVLMGFILFMGMLSSSTTFYLGLGCLLFLVFIENKIVFKMKLLLAILVGIIAAVLIVRQLIPDFWIKLITDTLNKLAFTNESGRVRSRTILHMLSVGLDHPILGIGYGMGRSLDVFTNLFSNLGIIGLLSFLLLFIRSIITAVRRLLRGNHQVLIEGIAVKKWCFLLINLSIIYCVTGISCPDLLYSYLWILFALLEKTGVFVRRAGERVSAEGAVSRGENIPGEGSRRSGTAAL